MRTVADLFSGNPAVRQIEQAFVGKLVRSGAKRAMGMTDLRQHDDHAEAVMNMLDNGAFDEEIAKTLADAAYAQPVAFDDLKEADVEDWARRRGIEVPPR